MDLRTLFILLSLMLIKSASSAAIESCFDDEECGDGKYCYLKTKTCTDCLKCNAYRRRDKLSSCAKEPLQCGDCLPGFETEVLNHGRTRDLCVPVFSTAAPQIMEASSSMTPYLMAGVVCVSIVGLLLLIKWSSKLIIKIRSRNCYLPSNDSRSTSSSVLYAPSAPPHTHADIKDESELSYPCVREEKREEKFQFASKYLEPQWVKSPNNNVPALQGLAADQQDEVDGPPNQESPAFLIDENTLPSEWTPGPEYENAQATGGAGGSLPLVTSFEGVLRLGTEASGNSGQGQQQANHNANQPQGAQYNNVTNITVINTSGNSSTGVFNITRS